MRRVVLALASLLAVGTAVLASATTVGATPTREVPIGTPTVWINANYPPPAPVQLIVGPNTTALQLLLPPEVERFGITGVEYDLEFHAGSLDGVDSSGAVSPFTSVVTVPWNLPSALLEYADDEAYGDVTLRQDGGSLHERYERVFPTRNAIQVEVPIRWDPASTATVAVADLRTPGAGLAVDYSYHANLNSPIAIRRGQRLTFLSSQSGFFSTGPWSSAWPGRLEARYGWKPYCGRQSVRGCGGGTQTKPIPVTVSGDGTRATVTFPTNAVPPPAHRHSEIVELRWIPRRQYIKDGPWLYNNPKVPGTYEVVREVALR